MHNKSIYFDSTSVMDVLSKARETLRIAVVFGGSKKDANRVINSGVNTRSWKSYEEVANDIATSLRKSGFNFVTVLPEGIDLASRLKNENIDLVWINSGGVQGIDPLSHLASMLEMAGIPYIGHNPVNASLLDNKQLLKWGMNSKGIPTAPFLAWYPMQGRFPGVDCSDYRRSFGNYRGPFILKPASGRASLLIEVINDPADLPDAIQKLTEKTRNAVIVEKYLSGREYTIAAAGPILHKNNSIVYNGDISLFSQIERCFEGNELFFTSMDCKPITLDRLKMLDPALNADEINGLNDLARKIYVGFGLETLVRVDIRADAEGNLFVLEANPKPDLKKPTKSCVSFVCCGLTQMNMSYGDLLLSLFAQRLHDLCAPNTGTLSPTLAQKLGIREVAK